MIIGYSRISLDKQVQQANGLEAQEYMLKQYAFKKGQDDITIFKDKGLSGKLNIYKRPGLMRALKCLSEGDILLVTQRDRLSRDVNIMTLIEKQVYDKGARIISCADEGTEDNNLLSPILRAFADVMAQNEREKISERTKLALEAKKRRKERIGYIPFGFKLETKINDKIKPKRIFPNDEEQEIIRKVVEAKNKNITNHQIAKMLNTEGLFNRNNNPWNKRNIQSILDGIEKHKCLLPEEE